MSNPNLLSENYKDKHEEDIKNKPQLVRAKTSKLVVASTIIIDHLDQSPANITRLLEDLSPYASELIPVNKFDEIHMNRPLKVENKTELQKEKIKQSLAQDQQHYFINALHWLDANDFIEINSNDDTAKIKPRAARERFLTELIAEINE